MLHVISNHARTHLIFQKVSMTHWCRWSLLAELHAEYTGDWCKAKRKLYLRYHPDKLPEAQNQGQFMFIRSAFEDTTSIEQAYDTVFFGASDDPACGTHHCKLKSQALYNKHKLDALAPFMTADKVVTAIHKALAPFVDWLLTMQVCSEPATKFLAVADPAGEPEPLTATQIASAFLLTCLSLVTLVRELAQQKTPGMPVRFIAPVSRTPLPRTAWLTVEGFAAVWLDFNKLLQKKTVSDYGVPLLSIDALLQRLFKAHWVCFGFLLFLFYLRSFICAI